MSQIGNLPKKNRGENKKCLKPPPDLDLIHPGRLTWNLQITHLERKMIFQTSMIMFYVNLQGCIYYPSHPFDPFGKVRVENNKTTRAWDLSANSSRHFPRTFEPRPKRKTKGQGLWSIAKRAKRKHL